MRWSIWRYQLLWIGLINILLFLASILGVSLAIVIPKWILYLYLVTSIYVLVLSLKVMAENNDFYNKF